MISLPLLLKIGMTLHGKCRLGNVYPLLNSYYVSALVQLLSHKDVVASEASNGRLVFKKFTNGVTLAMDFNDTILLSHRVEFIIFNLMTMILYWRGEKSQRSESSFSHKAEVQCHNAGWWYSNDSSNTMNNLPMARRLLQMTMILNWWGEKSQRSKSSFSLKAEL